MIGARELARATVGETRFTRTLDITCAVAVH